VSEPVAPGRGLRWLQGLTGSNGITPDVPASVRVAAGILGDEPACFLAVVPDAAARFPRARAGEVGLEEGWALAQQVRAVMAADDGALPRPLIAIVDVTSQAYGRSEELLGIHQACAAAVDAYASARLAGHPLIALLVGRAMSGAFLAHGYQANRILALDAPGVLVHAMSAEAAARVTRRSLAELRELSGRILPMAYEVRSVARLGFIDELIGGVQADAPTSADIERVRASLRAAIAAARAAPRDLAHRLTSTAARQTRAASIAVRRRLAEEWDER
jgi:malonate decarboxylase gamma subunit